MSTGMNPPRPERTPRLRRPCPRCQCGLRRVQRRPLDRLRDLFRPRMGRYRCLAKGCGWQGLLPRGARRPGGLEDAPLLSPAMLLANHRQVALGLLGAAGIAGIALASSLAYEYWNPRQEFVQVGPRQVARGFSHDGDKLPGDHPLLLARSPIAETDEVEPPAAAASAATASSSTPEDPLTLRRHCSWGVPGRNPYKGSVELALRTAKLPESVVQRVAADIRDKKVVDRLSITNGSIRADGSGRRFDPRQIAMSFGRTLCVDSRVNFKKNHVERADLYEATDAKGNVVAVMVPDVCGNVSVLSEVAEDDDLRGAEAASQEGRQASLRRMPATLVYRNRPGVAIEMFSTASNTVSTPGTLACVLAGLVAAAALRRRHRTRSDSGR
jgi:MYXO-CTERM domain-containing protein